MPNWPEIGRLISEHMTSSTSIYRILHRHSTRSLATENLTQQSPLLVKGGVLGVKIASLLTLTLVASFKVWLFHIMRTHANFLLEIVQKCTLKIHAKGEKRNAASKFGTQSQWFPLELNCNWHQRFFWTPWNHHSAIPEMKSTESILGSISLQGLLSAVWQNANSPFVKGSECVTNVQNLDQSRSPDVIHQNSGRKRQRNPNFNV